MFGRCVVVKDGDSECDEPFEDSDEDALLAVSVMVLKAELAFETANCHALGANTEGGGRRASKRHSVAPSGSSASAECRRADVVGLTSSG